MAMLLSMVSGTTVAHYIIKLFGFWSFTAASLVFPWSFICNVLLAECYHKKISFFVFLTAIVFSLLFGVIAQGVVPISLPFVLWGTFASIISFSVNTLIVTYRPPKKHYSFTVRYFLSTGVGEFLLVTIVTFSVFLPKFSLIAVVQIWLFSYITKIIFTIILAFPTKILSNFFVNHYELP
jgi:hypothetical protein